MVKLFSISGRRRRSDGPAADGPRKLCVITGGTSGIGARTAALFVEKGARVVIAGRRRERGEQLARTLGEFARFVPTDVAAEADVKAMIEQTSLVRSVSIA